MEILPQNRELEEAGGKQLLWLSLTALGVVYGDIGTSPLYAIRECFYGPHAISANRENVLGVLSLIIWSLILIISVKYLALVLRADNDGEGGVLALMALLLPKDEKHLSPGLKLVPLLGIFGAALLYGDGIITPAISVLSAVEGLEVATNVFDPYIIPLTVGILVGLFLFQRRGTAGVGIVFGPVMFVWFVTLMVLGLLQIIGSASILASFNPVHGFDFVVRNGLTGFKILGLVFLVVTGGEALYADIGHFGTRPIRVGWFGLALIALLTNYLGQGALLLSNPELAVNPFYHMSPGITLYPLVILATAATIIASQAVISGAFSLTLQAVHLGYLPRLRIRHTSASQYGQIYIPMVNWLLMVCTVALVFSFKRSTSLAAAYGVAVTTTMVITDVLLFLVMQRLWKWPLAASLAVAAFFVAIDLAFFGANIIKVPDGGWFPLLIAAILCLIMSTWRRGRQLLGKQIEQEIIPRKEFVKEIKKLRLKRVSGTAVYMTGNLASTPAAMVYNCRHNKVLHKRIILMTINYRGDAARVRRDRLQIGKEGDFHVVSANYGFMERPNVARIVELCNEHDLSIDLEETTFFVGGKRPLPANSHGMAIWRDKLYAFLERNSERATDYYNIPPERVIEIGVQVEI